MCLPLPSGLLTLPCPRSQSVRRLSVIHVRQHLYLLEPYASPMATTPVGAHLQVVPHPGHRSLASHSTRRPSLLTCASTATALCPLWIALCPAVIWTERRCPSPSPPTNASCPGQGCIYAALVPCSEPPMKRLFVIRGCPQ